MKSRITARHRGFIWVFLAAIFSIGVSCGGGGGGASAGGSSGGSNSPGLPPLIIATAIVDVNGDGKNDFIISTGQSTDGWVAPRIYVNDGNGSSFTLTTSAIPAQYHGSNAYAVAIEPADFNADGKIDLLMSVVDISYQSSQVQLYLGNGDGTFVDATSRITSPTATGGNIDRLRVADFDGNGALDFVTASPGGLGGKLYRNDGAGNFAPAAINITVGGTATAQSSFGLSTNDFWAGDINSDGKPDLLSPGTGVSFINTSTPGVLSFTQVSSGVSGIWLGALLDINGDGKLDVVGSQSYSGTTSTVPVVAYQGDGTGAFTQNNALLSTQPTLINGCQFLAADLNADNKQDLLIIDTGYDASPFPGSQNWLLLNNGAGALIDKTSANMDILAGYTHQAAIGDLNGDGSPDIVLNNSYQSLMSAALEPRFWLNNGSGVFTSYSPTFH